MSVRNAGLAVWPRAEKQGYTISPRFAAQKHPLNRHVHYPAECTQSPPKAKCPSNQGLFRFLLRIHKIEHLHGALWYKEEKRQVHAAPDRKTEAAYEVIRSRPPAFLV